MAIFHFSVKVISRASGRSAVAAAAYRSAERLRDDRLDRDHDFTNKSGVVHSEVMLPEGAPEELGTQEKLWNAVEAAELRRDAQLAREVEFAIPREMNQEQGIELARAFVDAEFVGKGMIADLNVHWDIGADGSPKPHAHVMLTMREVGHDGSDKIFGAKVREWNSTSLVEQWRERWAERVNERLAELDIDARVDHRSLEAQGIALEPQTKIGAPAQRMGRDGLEADRLVEHHAIARENGERIIADPSIALDAITRQQSTFTRRDLAMFVHRHSDGLDQFNQVMGAVQGSPDLVALGRDGRGLDRFTSQEMIAVEERLQRASQDLAQRELHTIAARDRDAALARAAARGLALSGEQRAAFEHVTSPKDMCVVVGYAGTGKSAMLGVAREAWEEAGMTVRGAALSGIAAENLEDGSGIASRTIASLEHGWNEGRDLLLPGDVLVIDEAGMVGTRQMERVLSHAAEQGAKVVLVGDPQQLQAIEAGAAFRAIHYAQGGVEITKVRRQQVDWQREATRQLATGRTGEALEAYRTNSMVHAADTRDEARGRLIERWDRDRQASPGDTRIILTHTNDEVRELNDAARGRLREAGELGKDVTISTERGERPFASGDRIMFLKNERGLDVRNGTLGTLIEVSPQRMAVRTDDGRSVAFDVKDYNQVDHGYAVTIHKAQGMTVDRTHVLATPGMDSHGAYVALSRHRDGVDLHYGRDDFADRSQLVRTLARERGKDMASDYAPRIDPARDPSTALRRAFAERRGIAFRERVAELVRRVVPEPVRDLFDGLRLGAAAAPTADREGQERGRGDPLCPERAGTTPPRPGPAALKARETGREAGISLGTARREVLVRHARTVNAIFAMQQDGLAATPDQVRELQRARGDLDALRPHASRDIEAAYKRDPGLVREAASGNPARARDAMLDESEMRTNPRARADRFVERWRGLEARSASLYTEGQMRDYRDTRSAMADMAKSLERDPQLESLLAGRKAQLGIAVETGRSLGRELAFSHGLDLGLGRGLGI